MDSLKFVPTPISETASEQSHHSYSFSKEETILSEQVIGADKIGGIQYISGIFTFAWVHQNNSEIFLHSQKKIIIYNRILKKNTPYSI